jgi:hypothetical protein
MNKVLETIVIAFETIETSMLDKNIHPAMWKRFKRQVYRDIERQFLDGGKKR